MSTLIDYDIMSTLIDYDNEYIDTLEYPVPTANSMTSASMHSVVRLGQAST